MSCPAQFTSSMTRRTAAKITALAWLPEVDWAKDPKSGLTTQTCRKLIITMKIIGPSFISETIVTASLKMEETCPMITLAAAVLD
jgi:hypothetical protein